MPITEYTTFIGSGETIRYRDDRLPESIPLLRLPKRNPLRFCYSPISKIEELPDIISMFTTLGVCIPDDTINQIADIVKDKKLRDVGDTDRVYLGVDGEDTFNISNSESVSRLRQLCLLQNKAAKKGYNVVLGDYNMTAHLLETEEIARAFFKNLDDNNVCKEGGGKWIDDQGNFPYPHGRDTAVCPRNGIVNTRQHFTEAMYTFCYSHSKLFGMYNESFFKWEMPEGMLEARELVAGKPYVYRDSRNSPSDSDYIVIFDGDLNRNQDVIDGRFNYCVRVVNLNGLGNTTKYFEPITRSHSLYERYKTAYDEHQDYLSRVRAMERERYLTNRKDRLERKRNNIDNYNRDVKTQLLSESLHDMLTKALDNKVARCLLKLNKLGYLDGSTRNITIRRSNKEMTYTPSGKTTEMTENNTWVSKGRQNGKYGKVIRKVLREQVPKLKFTDYQIEKLVNHLKAQASDGAFNIVKGEDIAEWYDGKNYKQDVDTGTLGCSCMRDSHCRGFLDIYVKNPDKVKMVILKKEGLLIGRALVWEDKWMDRIYGTDATISAFKTFAKEKGWHCKSSQNSEPYQGWINPETGEKYQEDVTIHLKTDFEEYPYADTMCYIDVDGGMISNSSSNINSCTEMRDTGGGLEGDENMVYDEYDDRYIHVDDAVFIESHCFDTHYNNAGQCDVDGCYYLNDDLVETHDGRIVYDSNAMYNDEAGVYYTEEDAVYLCEYDNTERLEDITPSIWIEELQMTVSEGNEDAAYEQAGYEMIDGSWTLNEEA